MLEILLLLIFAHFLCDYPLQGDFLSRAKNSKNPVEGVPWYQAMMAHCGIHAGAVLFITGSPFIALLEFVLHFLMDDAKCRGEVTYNQDQAFHIGCKIVWTGLLFWVLT